ELQQVYQQPDQQDSRKDGIGLEDLDEESFQRLVDERCVDNVRMLIVDAVQNAKTGHPGMAMGLAEVGYYLYRHVLRYNPRNPTWFNRDRFVLSAGHGCLLILLGLILFRYCLLEDLRRLRKLGSRTPGHPENTVTDGIEVTTDGCAMEGISHEAASLAAHWKLHKLTLIYDDNDNTAEGPITLAFSEDISTRFKALGWNTINVDNTQGDISSFKDAISAAIDETGKPTFIRAHDGTFDEADVKKMREKMKWNNREPFSVIPMNNNGSIPCREMQIQANHGETLEREWYSKLNYFRNKYPKEAAEFEVLLNGEVVCIRPSGCYPGILRKVCEQLVKVLPGLIGGSADLASSMATRTSHLTHHGVETFAMESVSMQWQEFQMELHCIKVALSH
ncbi:hypothetical protein Tsubulata_046109, partial [Turnera subulata]